jgi:putative oxidoreductase
MKFLSNSYSYRDAGLLFLRFGVGLMFMTHGGPKLAGGPAWWREIGKSMDMVGVHFLPTFWGFMAGFAEFGGGLLLILGLFFRPACLLLAFTMVIAAAKHLTDGDGLSGASHAIEAGIVFVALLFIGPGNYSLDNRLFKSSKTLRKPVRR